MSVKISLLGRYLPLRQIKNIQYALCVSSQSCGTSRAFRSDDPSILQPVSKSSSTELRIKKISRAMKAYLERANNQENLLILKNEEYEIGKRHLANIMGVEVEAMTQGDIDRAIEYLMPSGLYHVRARPMMKPPEYTYPKEKVAQFDYTGRPFSPFFYTGKPNFYKAVHDCMVKFVELDALEDQMIRKGILNVPEEKLLDLSGGEFLTLDKLSSIFLEKIKDEDYKYFINTLTRLAKHPYGFRERDFIWKFRRDFEDASTLAIAELIHDENGRAYIDAKGEHMWARADVRVWTDGTGKMDINGKDISYFQHIQERERLLFPLDYSGLLGKVDVEITVKAGGMSSQATAIRHGMSLCLRSMVSEETREKMRLAGLFTLDRRFKERKKPGQKGARAKYKWKKR